MHNPMSEASKRDSRNGILDEHRHEICVSLFSCVQSICLDSLKPTCSTCVNLPDLWMCEHGLPERAGSTFLACSLFLWASVSLLNMSNKASETWCCILFEHTAGRRLHIAASLSNARVFGRKLQG